MILTSVVVALQSTCLERAESARWSGDHPFLRRWYMGRLFKVVERYQV
jgi:hypothetical protein